PLLIFAASVGLLLLIGCANVANLMLTKLHIRQREIAIRAALGATRASLIWRLLKESIALAACGGLLGIPIAYALLQLLMSFSPGNVPVPDRIPIDTSVLLFTIGCSIVAGVLSGLAPALKAGSVNVAGTIAESSRGASGGHRHSRL